MADKLNSNEMARHRTGWAEDRTPQANERTFAGWMRTGTAEVGVALGLKAMFGAFEPTWAAKAVTTIFLRAGLIMFWSAWHNACATLRRLGEHSANARLPRIFTIISAAMVTGAAATGFIMRRL